MQQAIPAERDLPAREAPRAFVKRLLMPVAAAFLYPILLNYYSAAAHAAVVATGLARICFVGLSAGAMLAACVVPGVALMTLLRLNTDPFHNTSYLRRLLHVLVATPPVYVLASQLLYLVGLSKYLDLIWCTACAAVALVNFGFRHPQRALVKADAQGPWAFIRQARVIHGGAALLLLLGFIVMHLANHLSAFWSLDAQRMLMKTLRMWYRSDWVEPGIVGLCVLMIMTGLPLIAFHTRTAGDRYRRLQTAAGGYLLAFLLAHVGAVFWVRSGGTETDWVFASGGPAGLIMGGSYALIPYYLCAVTAVAVHAGLGLRLVALGHGSNPRNATRLVVGVSALGAVSAILIIAALLGVHVVA